MGTIVICCRKGDLFQGSRVDPCLTHGNELSKETHMLAKQETLLRQDIQAESSGVREARRTALPCGSGFMVMGLVFRWSLATHSDSRSFLVAPHRSAKTDSSEKDSGRLVEHTDWHFLSPFDLFLIILLGLGSLVPCSLPGPSVIR